MPDRTVEQTLEDALAHLQAQYRGPISIEEESLWLIDSVLPSLDQPDAPGAMRTLQLMAISVTLGMYVSKFGGTVISDRLDARVQTFLKDIGRLLTELPGGMPEFRQE